MNRWTDSGFGLLKIWLVILPVVTCWYIGLFITMLIWYPSGLSAANWQSHMLHFSIVYVIWIAVFFAYRLFELETLRILSVLFTRLSGALAVCMLMAIVYFYFQPELLITPRRFLLVHVGVSGLGIIVWYVFMHYALPYVRQSTLFVHPSFIEREQVMELLDSHTHTGIRYGGLLPDPVVGGVRNAIVVLPPPTASSANALRDLFALRSHQVRFIEFTQLYELVTRKIYLDQLNELWFLRSIDYGAHWLYDFIKRFIDIVIGFIGVIVWLVTFPVIAMLIAVDSRGTIFFSQPRVGLHGIPFTVYKYRTMTPAAHHNSWTEVGDLRITRVGKWLRRLRLDELPQFLNILKGDMSLVGPRPEQVHFVEQLRQQIPYYDERHMVKPGLTGWAQLHVYASTVDETKRKLQYDLYYIKHRSLLFDIEVILKTIYHILAMDGR